MMHDVQIPHERLETALRSGNVTELDPRMPSLASGGALRSQEPRMAPSWQPDDMTFSFEQVREKVQADDKGKWDIVLPRSEVLMRDGRLLFPDAKAYECEDGLTPLPWATGQICQRLNMPTSYFRKCPAFLQDAQFNYWNAKSRSAGQADGGSDAAAVNGYPRTNGGGHSRDGFVGEPFNGESFNSGTSFNNGKSFNYGEPAEYQNDWPHGPGNGHQFKNGIYAGTVAPDYWLLRAKDQTLRAVLTDRYTPLDNRTLMDCLHRTLPVRLEIQWLALDDESFHLRIIDPMMTREVLPGDPLMTGIHISNSEIGRRSVTVDCMIYRQVCTNGLIKLVKGKSILSQRHVAVSPPHFVVLLKQSLSTALSTATGFMEQMEWSTQEPIRDVEAEMKSLMQHWHLSQGFIEEVKSSLAKERSDQQETVFGLVNAITSAAQSLDTEGRYDMEILAGKLLERKSLQSASSAARSRSVNVPANLQNGSDVAEAIEAAEVLFETEAVPSAANANDTAGAVAS